MFPLSHVDPQQALLFSIALFLVVGLFLVVHYRYWVRRLTQPLTYDLQEKLQTSDGCAIELRRLLPRGAPSPLPPVLLVHGIAINHRNLDLGERLSLARVLRDEGRDVWLLTLRSGRHDLRWSERRKVNFVAMMHHDLPTAVETILGRTGAESLDYVGFSMGGMLLYASLGRTVPESSISRVVIIGSPGQITVPFRALSRLSWLPTWIIPCLPLRLLSRLFAFASESFLTPLHRLPFNPDNCAPGTARHTLVDGIQDMSRALNREFAVWAFSGAPWQVEGQPVLQGLARVSIPIRFFAGAADHLASPRVVRSAFDAWGAELSEIDKGFTVLGREMGAERDYGHGDLAIGEHAERDVFAPAAAFLGRREEER